jgi:hypothetical protein
MEPFVHEATLAPAGEFDDRAPGGAITVALCGHWEHEGSCRWPHYTYAERVGKAVRIRTLFACDSEDERDVRDRIESALRAGSIKGDDGAISTWSVLSVGPAHLRGDETDHAQRLASLG